MKIESASAPLEFFRVDDLVASFPGSTRKLWQHTLLPKLRAAGVLVKVGRRFVGRRPAIEAAVLA